MAKPKGNKGWYGQIGMDQSNFQKLKKLRTDLGRLMRINLSWNDFINRVMPYVEEGVKKEAAK